MRTLSRDAVETIVEALREEQRRATNAAEQVLRNGYDESHAEPWRKSARRIGELADFIAKADEVVLTEATR